MLPLCDMYEGALFKSLEGSLDLATRCVFPFVTSPNSHTARLASLQDRSCRDRGFRCGCSFRCSTALLCAICSMCAWSLGVAGIGSLQSLASKDPVTSSTDPAGVVIHLCNTSQSLLKSLIKDYALNHN